MSAAKSDKAEAVKAPKAAKAPKSPKSTKGKKVVDIKDAPKKVASAEKLINLLTTPHITEKTSLAMQNANTYSFRVLRNSSKPEIKAAVEGLFGVKVKAVNTLVTQGKKKFFRGMKGQRSDYKKAIVTLEAGQTIDVTTGV